MIESKCTNTHGDCKLDAVKRRGMVMMMKSANAPRGMTITRLEDAKWECGEVNLQQDGIVLVACFP